MRPAFMSTREVSTTYLKDMTHYANLELEKFGACRRR